MELEDINKKVTRAFFSLTFRKAILDLIGFITIFVILPQVLPVSTIGIFGIATAILTFFTYFSDIGLAAALIQKKEVTEEDFKTTFFIQEIIAVIILLIIWFISPIFVYYYNLGVDALALIRALGISFFLTSLKVIPSIRLERELKFGPIVWVDVIEALSFNLILIYLALQGYGVFAFVYAVLVRGVIGVIALYLLAPWRMGIGFSKLSAKSLVNFGIPFQLNSILALLKDRLTPLVTASIIGATGMGYVTWAQGVANRPLEFMSIIIRIAFPVFSRLQDQEEQLKKIVEKSLFLTVLFIYPLLFGLMAVAPSFIEYIGKEKWEPALPLLYLFALSTFLSIPSTIFTNVLNGIGKIGITLKLMIVWTILTWILSPMLAIIYGYIGVAMASALISLTSLVPIMLVTRMLKIDLIGSLWQPLVASLVMGGIIFKVSEYFVRDTQSFVLTILTGGVIYIVLIGLLAKNEIFSFLKTKKI